MSFNSNVIDVAALREDILKTAEERNRQATAAWAQKVRDDIESSFTDLTREQRDELMTSLAQLDARLTGGLDTVETRMKDNTQKLETEIYQTVDQQRAQDLEVINLRFDSFELNNAIQGRQTDAVLDTLVQLAELSFREAGGQ